MIVTENVGKQRYTTKSYSQRSGLFPRHANMKKRVLFKSFISPFQRIETKWQFRTLNRNFLYIAD